MAHFAAAIDTLAIWRNPEPSPTMRRHCSTCSWLRAGGTSHPLSGGAGPVQSQPDPLAGGIHLVGSLGQHRAPEELRCGAPLPGVYAVPDGHDADIGAGLTPPGCGPPSSKFLESLSRKATTMVSPSWTRVISSCQLGRWKVRPLATSE